MNSFLLFQAMNILRLIVILFIGVTVMFIIYYSVRKHGNT
jgi:hypothetical protein